MAKWECGIFTNTHRPSNSQLMRYLQNKVYENICIASLHVVSVNRTIYELLITCRVGATKN